MILEHTHGLVIRWIGSRIGFRDLVLGIKFARLDNEKAHLFRRDSKGRLVCSCLFCFILHRVCSPSRPTSAKKPPTRRIKIDLSAIVDRAATVKTSPRGMRPLLMQINIGWLFSVPNIFDRRAEARLAKKGIDASTAWRGTASRTEMRLRDGRVIQFQTRALPDGGRMLTYFDITDLKRTEENATQARDIAETALADLSTRDQ